MDSWDAWHRRSKAQNHFLQGKIGSIKVENASLGCKSDKTIFSLSADPRSDDPECFHRISTVQQKAKVEKEKHLVMKIGILNFALRSPRSMAQNISAKDQRSIREQRAEIRKWKN